SRFSRDWSSDVCSSDLAVDDAERTSNDAVATPVTDIGLHIYGIELGANNGTGRARFQTSGRSAMFTNIRHQQPGELTQTALLTADRKSVVKGERVDSGR